MFLDVNPGLGMHRSLLDNIFVPIKNLDLDATSASKITNAKDSDVSPFYDTEKIGKLVSLKVQSGASDNGRTGIRYLVSKSTTNPLGSNTGTFMEVAEEKFIPVPKGYNLWIVGGNVVVSLMAGENDL